MENSPWLQEHLNNVCDNKQSPQLMLYNIFADMQLTQLKSYIMAQSAYALMQIFEKGHLIIFLS